MKGQAFDTFKLLIAAVVAVAILGILLAILQGITPPSDPATLIREQLSKAHQYEESAFVSQAQATFVGGSSFKGDSFKDAIGGSGDITFDCSDDLDNCDDDPNTTLKIDAPFDAYIGACCEGTECLVSILLEDESAGCP